MDIKLLIHISCLSEIIFMNFYCMLYVFFMYEPAKGSTLCDGKHVQRVVVTILITCVDNATMQYDDMYMAYWDATASLGASISHSQTKHVRTNAVILGWSLKE